MKQEVMAETLVIGAGPAGLATGACLRKEGLPFEMIDRAESVGASWRAHYDRLHLHTPKATSALPYQKFPSDMPRYPSRDDVVRYLEAYAKRFELSPKLSQNVERITRSNGGWRVETSSSIFGAKRVVLAAGYNRVPFEPPIEGREKFSGAILHSSLYKSGSAFRGKRVLVVGFGNSGAEIALDLVEQGAEAAVSVRSGANIVPRDFLLVPMQMHTMMISMLPMFLKDLIARTVSLASFGNLQKHGLPAPELGVLTQIARKKQFPVLDVGAVREIKRGKIRVYPALEKLAAAGAVFGGKTVPFDAIVLATGFRTGLREILEAPAMLDGDLPETDPAKTGADGIYFVGYTVPATGVLRRIAREARCVARDIERRRNGR